MTEKIEVEKFKKLIMEMYNGFPNWWFSEQIEQIIITEKVRESLIESKFLIKDNLKGADGKMHPSYMLGPAALPLVSAWKSEELAQENKRISEQIKNYTVGLYILTISLAILGLYQIIYTVLTHPPT